MAQVWALHDALPDHTRQALLLGAFTGLRTNEGVALRVSDIDFMRGVVSWAIQHLAEPLKSETSRTAVPIREQLALELAAYVQCYGGSTVVTDEIPACAVARPRRPRVALVARAGGACGAALCSGACGEAPVPRPSALLREPAHRRRRRREGRPDAPSARERNHDAEHLRAHVARRRRVRPRCRWGGAGSTGGSLSPTSCGLSAD